MDRPARSSPFPAFSPLCVRSHVNAFRQGRSLGTHLVVGVNDDESIARCKGAPPVMNDAERLAMVKGCKFVDEVVPNVPYVMSDEYVRWVIKTYNIDFVVHGDDPCIVDGRDVYESAQRLGKYMTIPRTEGVSTTEIVGRMLLLTSDHLLTSSPQSVSAPGAGSASPLLEPGCKGATLSQVMPPELELDALPPSMVLKVDTKKPPPAADATPPMNASPAMNASFIRESKFLTTSRMLRLFASGCAAPPAGARVVYVDGGWDMFHAGHVDFLRRARALGDYLLVGVHNDVQVNRRRGKNFPIMNLNERTLSVLSCRHVSDVVIDPPWHLTKEMLAALDITVVAHGSTNDPNDDDGLDPYEVPKAMGIFHELPSTMDLTVESILSRLHANRARLEKKVAKKQQDEKEYYDNRYGFAPKDSQKPA
jgi:ethanolamine-phosphate cytidylyltransferase